MSESEYNRRAQEQLQKELAELETPQAKYQAILDRWREQCAAAEAEERRLRRYLDPFNTGIYND
jgi:hypothetical protein